MSVELGDHVWYWDGNISFALDIPRAEWFPGSTGPTDYLGHGKEIFHYVFHADEIARGRPQMRNFEGSFAWLNNNPGNLTGVNGGPDFGQYPGKFSWHHFLIFPTWEAGLDAIAAFLRRPPYVSLSILDAFKRYAPVSDGNDPVAYATAVAAAAGVSMSTIVGDLEDDQMWQMQKKIAQVEGADRAGNSFAYDSPGLHPEIVELLGESAPGGCRPATETPENASADTVRRFTVTVAAGLLDDAQAHKIESAIQRTVTDELTAIDVASRVELVDPLAESEPATPSGGFDWRSVLYAPYRTAGLVAAPFTFDVGSARTNDPGRPDKSTYPRPEPV